MKYINCPKYDANALIDFANEKLGMKNDAALSRRLEMSPPQISKVRHNVLPIGDSLLVKIHEATDVPTKELKKIAGMV